MSQPTGMIARSTDWPPQIVDVSEAKLSTASFRGEQVISITCYYQCYFLSELIEPAMYS